MGAQRWTERRAQAPSTAPTIAVRPGPQTTGGLAGAEPCPTTGLGVGSPVGKRSAAGWCGVCPSHTPWNESPAHEKVVPERLGADPGWPRRESKGGLDARAGADDGPQSHCGRACPVTGPRQLMGNHTGCHVEASWGGGPRARASGARGGATAGTEGFILKGHAG